MLLPYTDRIVSVILKLFLGEYLYKLWSGNFFFKDVLDEWMRYDF